MPVKLPPLEKIFEAWSAVASGRVTLDPSATPESGEALVRSSNHDKTYHVAWRDGVFTSDDNASYWQGYPGYPVGAVLMKLGLVPFDPLAARPFANVDWNAANKKAKGDYARALATIEDELGLDESAREEADQAAKTALEALSALDIVIKRPARKRSGNAAR